MNTLIAIEGARGWDQALERACTLLPGPDGTVTLLYIIPRSASYGRGLPVHDEWDDLEAEQAQSAAVLQAAVQRLRERGVRLPVETMSCVGDPQELLVRIAAETGADVLILGAPLSPCTLSAPRVRAAVRAEDVKQAEQAAPATQEDRQLVLA